MTGRDLWVAGVEVLRAFVVDDLVLARAIRERDYRSLLAAATIAKRGVKEALAITDPGLYSTLMQAITLMNLKGYGVLDLEKLRKLVEAGASDAPAKSVGGNAHD